MTLDRRSSDPVLSALAQLRPYDVTPNRAERLRARCRARLVQRTRSDRFANRFGGGLWRRAVGPALLGSWCALYLIETIRHAAGIYMR